MTQVAIYQIRIKEPLDSEWAEWFLPLVIDNEATNLVTPTGATLTGATLTGATLTGPVRDQAELFGLLSKVRDLNLTLLAVNYIEHAQP